MTDINKEQIPYFEDKESMIIPGQPVVERQTINAIIYDRAKDTVLCLDWEKFNWKTFIIGGIEKDEDVVEAAIREIKEETGYGDLRFMAEVGRTRSAYYAAHKKENRISNAVGLLFELKSDRQEKIDESETVNHVFRWIKKSDVAAFVNLASQKYIWEKALPKI